jgi:hypothetical protein
LIFPKCHENASSFTYVKKGPPQQVPILIPQASQGGIFGRIFSAFSAAFSAALLVAFSAAFPLGHFRRHFCRLFRQHFEVISANVK